MFNLKLNTEAVAQRCSVKKMLLEIFENLQENTYARVFFLRKLQVQACNFSKKRDCGAGAFLYILQSNTFSYRTTLVAGSVNTKGTKF